VNGYARGTDALPRSRDLAGFAASSNTSEPSAGVTVEAAVSDGALVLALAVALV
jgi:hypothetical protein